MLNSNKQKRIIGGFLRGDQMIYRLTGQHHFWDCGKVVSTLPFLHADRINAEFLLLIGMEGSLHIDIGGKPYHLSPRDILLIPPFTPIHGISPTDHLTYFWCHFDVSGVTQALSIQEARQKYHEILAPSSSHEVPLFLPDFFHLSDSSRSIIFSQQLLNFVCCPEYPHAISDYLLGCLLIELSIQAADVLFSQPNGKVSQRFQEILQWVRVNAQRKIEVAEIAATFNYNADYLSQLFRERLGISLKRYIIKVKLDIVKELLISTDKSVKEISRFVSYDDEKYLMRLFKKYEGVTPSEFRNAYAQTKFNTNFRISKRIDTKWVSFLEE